MSSPYGPATSLVNYVRKLPDEALNAVGKMGDFIQHPIQGVENLMHQQPPQRDTRWMAPVEDVQKANDSFTTMKRPLK